MASRQGVTGGWSQESVRRTSGLHRAWGYGRANGARLMFKDFSLIEQRALALSVPMPLTAVAAQVAALEHARESAAEGDEDFSVVIRTMQQMAGIPT